MIHFKAGQPVKKLLDHLNGPTCNWNLYIYIYIYIHTFTYIGILIDYEVGK